MAYQTRACDWCGNRFPVLHGGRKCCSAQCAWARQRDRKRNRNLEGPKREETAEYMPDEATIWAEAAEIRERALAAMVGKASNFDGERHSSRRPVRMYR